MSEKLTIDLLPPQFKAENIKRAKFYKIQAVGVAVIMVTAFLASSVIGLRIVQTQEVLRTQAKLTQAEEKVSEFKSSQASLLLLKDRLSVISEFLGNPSKQFQMYVLIERLLPQKVVINTISVDKGGEALVLATSTDISSLDVFIAGLLQSELNEDKIREVSIESLNRGKDGLYRLSFKVRMKG